MGAFHKTFFYALALTLLFISPMTLMAQGAGGLDHSRLQMSQANERLMDQAINFFQQGQYTQAISAALKISGQKQTESMKHYLLGLSYNRTDQFQKAIESFQMALQLDNKSPDIFYEMGQAHYALNRMRRGMQLFLRSVQNKYMEIPSLYYLGHMSQILEEHREARDYFTALINHEEVDLTMQQIARFQRAESLVAMAREREEREARRLVDQYVLPELEIALGVLPNSQMAQDIAMRTADLKREFGLDPNILVNGRPIAAKRWQVDFTQRFTYDSNITLANDLPTTQATLNDSFISYTELLGGYNFVLNRRFIVNPILRLSKQIHTDRDNSEVYQNDNQTIRPSIRTRAEYTLFGKPAAVLLDWDHDFTQRDREGQKDVRFFARSNTYTLGHRAQFFPFGETTFRAKKRFYRPFNTENNFDVTSFSVDQVVIFPWQHLLIGMLNFDQTRAETQKIISSDTWLGRFDYIIPALTPEFSLGFNFTYLRSDYFNDPSKSSADQTFIPGINLTRRMGEMIRLRTSYDYSKAKSDNENGRYTKHVIAAELKIIF